MRILFLTILFLSFADYTLALDEDNDGLSDMWQRNYAVETNDIDGDNDQDNASNGLEFLWGSDPNLPNNPLIDAKIENDYLCFKNLPISKKRVKIIYKNSKEEKPIEIKLIKQYSMKDEFCTPVLSPKSYFVLIPLEDLDTDSDGLTDYEEFLIGTNPNSKDSNGDRSNDGFEVSTIIDLTKIHNMVPADPEPGEPFITIDNCNLSDEDYKYIFQYEIDAELDPSWFDLKLHDYRGITFSRVGIPPYKINKVTLLPASDSSLDWNTCDK